MLDRPWVEIIVKIFDINQKVLTSEDQGEDGREVYYCSNLGQLSSEHWIDVIYSIFLVYFWLLENCNRAPASNEQDSHSVEIESEPFTQDDGRQNACEYNGETRGWAY